MFARIISAAVLIPLTLAVVFLAPRPLFLLVVGIVGTICTYEYLQLAGKMNMRGTAWFSYAGFWFMLITLQQPGLTAAGPVSVLLLTGFIVSMWRRAPVRERVQGMASNIFGILYLSVCLLPAVRLRFDVPQAQGREWLVILLATIWIGDTAALVIGKRFGKTPFAPVISPRKTNAGAVGGLLGGTLAAILLRFLLFPGLGLGHVIAASLLMGMFGQLGDLAESMLKRAAGAKDSSGLIPGHGGMLDRIDSLLFALPALYFYLLMINSA
jgi:phosphatidate cytidylyltransferase